MIPRLLCITIILAFAASALAQDSLHFLPKADGAGKGMKVVLIAGDEEYRSEESMPALAKILSQRHGFECDVLFSADADGTIQPGKTESLTNPEALDKAEAIVMSLRFRKWNDAALAKFEAAVNRGVPLIALRTSTHLFNGIPKESRFAKWNWNSKDWPGGFGRQVLGETWVAHHGAHKKEGTRGVIEPAQKDHPILRGVSDVFGDTDVYTANPLPDATVLMRGEVTETLEPTSKAVAGKKNDPLQPILWTREHKNDAGRTNRIVTTTMGSASDLKNEGLRRIVVNGVFWGLGLDVPAKTDVTLVDPWVPSFYGFGTHRKGLKVSDHALGKALGEPPPPEPKKDGAKKPEGAAKPAGGGKVALATGKPAQFVRIELPGDKRILTLAEVEVFKGGGQNVAREGKATQSSTGHGGVAERAIDGNKDPDFKSRGQTHTQDGGTANPWWELDLGNAAQIEQVVVFNRRGYEERLADFTLVLLDAQRKEVFRIDAVPAPGVVEIDVKDCGKLAFRNFDGKPTAAPGQKTAVAAKPPPPHAPNEEPAPAASERPQKVAPPEKGEHIVLIGNGLAERDVYYGQIETELHLRYPAHELFFRNMGHVGDTPGFRPHPSRPSQWAFPGADKFHPDKKVHNGKGFFSTPDQWLTHLKADTIVAFFGYNESFDGPTRVANFEGELDAWVQHTLSKAYNGKAAPRLVLVSPIAFENQSAKRDLPNGEKENANLKLYSEAIEKVARNHKLTFIDLFTPTRAIYAKGGAFFTTGGFIPTEAGYRQIAELLATGLYGAQAHVSKADPKLVNTAVQQKDWFWNVCDYNILNGVHTHGGRYNPYGPQNYPDEVKKAREMAALRDALIYQVASGQTRSLTVDDSKTHQLPPVPTNYQPSAKTGSQTYLYGGEALKTLTVPEGYKVELFATEKEFPNLANPMQLSFDNKGRLWVAVMPTYPHYRPGDAMPDDKILIYEDTNGDGKADKEIVWADKLHLPIGFEFAPEGVYVSEEPNLVLLRDTNGDDKADSKEIILGGFDSHDTHHAISAYTADPSGAFFMCEGVFLHSNVETPYGPVRCVDGGFFRYSPQRGHLERTIQMAIPNPWGYVFDQWGQDFLLHTSGTTMNWALPVQVKPTFGSKTPSTRDLVPDGHKVRPTSGLEVVSSRHFPDEVQGDLIYCNAIGFLGIKQVQIEDDGTGWKTAHRHNLLQSNDGNFRPADLEFAPDGSLYVIDWHNVLIGHMQHNARDPLRDHVHGRIYRITYPARPLVKPAPVAGAPIPVLLENLKLPESRTRYRTRRELRARDPQQVLAALKTWVAGLGKDDVHTRLEALWVTWGLNQVDETLLREMLASPDFHARAAAVRVLRYNTHRIADHATLLEKAASDEHGRVRLEAVVAASWLPNISAAKKIVATAAALPQDEWNKNAIKTATDRLAGIAESEKPEHPVVPPPPHLTDAAKKQFTTGQEIYFREGLCVTCHQANGAGLDPAFPSIVNSPWITGDRDRLIKLVAYGLMGPMEVNGKKYDGQVPMTPFGGMLNDDELAAVLTFVRNHFGNKADPITAAEVKAVRDANPGRAALFTVDELLKQHPMKP